MTSYNSILYSKGYIFSDKQCSVPEHFHKINVHSYHFYHDEELKVFYSAGQSEDWIIVCGILLDALTGNADINYIGSNLLQKRQESKSLFLDYLDYLGGRYIVIIKCQDDLEVYNDACGNKIVNYLFRSNNFCLSSHLELIKRNFEVELSSVEKEKRKLDVNFRYGYPGMSTPYRDIKKLIPNTTLNLKTRDIVRYFPRENLESKSIESAYNTIKVLFNTQYKSLLSLGYKPLISLTAGWDSRFTVSILDDLTEASYFTYRSFEAHTVDISVAEIISERLKLDHYSLYSKDFNFDLDYEKYNSIISKNTYLKHGRKISYMYFNTFQSHNYIHLRSNLSEIGRFFYGKCKDYQINELSLLFLWGSINKNYISSQVVRNSFREFFVKNEYYNLYNYNAFDLFYWEHRMGQWNSEVLIEGDPAFNTIQFFNCRAVLKNLLALSEDDRKNDSIYKYAIFKKGKKELLDIPLNPSKEELNHFLDSGF